MIMKEDSVTREAQGNSAFHFRDEENGDYFLVRVADIGVIYVGVRTGIPDYWEVYVAGTRIMVPPAIRVHRQVRDAAYAYALGHPGEVTPGLLAEARRHAGDATANVIR